MHSLDGERGEQLYTPRRPKSRWARSNKERVERLLAAGMMEPAGLAVVEAAKESGTWTALDDAENLVVPDDLAAALSGLAGRRRLGRVPAVRAARHPGLDPRGEAAGDTGAPDRGDRVRGGDSRRPGPWANP